MSESQKTTDDEAQTTNINISEKEATPFQIGTEGSSGLEGYVEHVTGDYTGDVRVKTIPHGQLETRFVSGLTADDLENRVDSDILKSPEDLVDHNDDLEVTFTIYPSAEDLFKMYAERVDNEDAVHTLEDMLRSTDSQHLAEQAWTLAEHAGLDDILNPDTGRQLLADNIVNLYKIPEDSWDDNIVQFEYQRA